MITTPLILFEREMNSYYLTKFKLLFHVSVIFIIILLVFAPKCLINFPPNKILNEKQMSMGDIFDQRAQKLKEWCKQNSASGT